MIIFLVEMIREKTIKVLKQKIYFDIEKSSEQFPNRAGRGKRVFESFLFVAFIVVRVNGRDSNKHIKIVALIF